MPMSCIPLLFLLSCHSIQRERDRKKKKKIVYFYPIFLRKCVRIQYQCSLQYLLLCSTLRAQSPDSRLNTARAHFFTYRILFSKTMRILFFTQRRRKNFIVYISCRQRTSEQLLHCR